MAKTTNRRQERQQERQSVDNYVRSKKPTLFYPFRDAFEKLFNGAKNLEKYISGR